MLANLPRRVGELAAVCWRTWRGIVANLVRWVGGVGAAWGGCLGVVRAGMEWVCR